MSSAMKITLEFPGDTVEEAMSKVRAFAEAWANVYANAGLPIAPAGRQATKEETREETKRNNPFLDEVAALEQREDFKPAEKPPARKEIEAAFRRMVERFRPDEAAALEAGRSVLKKLGAASVPAIPEEKFVECLQLLRELQS